MGSHKNCLKTDGAGNAMRSRPRPFDFPRRRGGSVKHRAPERVKVLFAYFFLSKSQTVSPVRQFRVAAVPA